MTPDPWRWVGSVKWRLWFQCREDNRQIQSPSKSCRHTDFNSKLHKCAICYPSINYLCTVTLKYDIFSTKHLKTTAWCGPQGADSRIPSLPERPGTKTRWYFCIKNVVQRYKNYHIDRKYSSPCLFIVITTTAQFVTAEMFNFNVHVDCIWLHCSGSFRVVPDFSTPPFSWE